jgi:hypothetical protein
MEMKLAKDVFLLQNGSHIINFNLSSKYSI